MQVRLATEDDLPAIVAMARAFYADTSYATIAVMDDLAAATLADMAMASGTMLVADDGERLVGMVCLVVVPFMFNASKTSADEVAWWVDPSAQGAGVGRALLEAIEPACRAAGADMIRMMTLSTSPKHAGALYERAGYSHSETSYTKVL